MSENKLNRTLHECFEQAAVPKVLLMKADYWPTLENVEETIADQTVRQVLRCQAFLKNSMVTLIATDQGVYAFRKSTLLKKYGKGQEYFPYSQITGVTTSFHPTWRTCIEFSRASNVDKYGYMDADDAAKFVALVSQKSQDERSSPALQPIVTPDADPLDRLRKLKELAESGVISQQEFELKKAKLLDEI